MIRAVQLQVAGFEPLATPVAALFEHAGPGYCPLVTRPYIACRNQLRAQLSWPVLEAVILRTNAHLAVLARAYGAYMPVEVRMTPLYFEPIGGRRSDASDCEQLIGMVDVALLFLREGPRTDLVYVYRHRDRAQQLLMNQLRRRRRQFEIEWLAIPEPAYASTPPRLAIHQAGFGRVLPGPDVVVGGRGPTIAQLLADGVAAVFAKERLCG
jgi:hypothetical protein